MARGPRVVAELGRPETPQETADRKAAASQTYRSAKSFKNLLFALAVTIAIVAVIYFGVPRATGPEPEPVDVPAAAAEAQLQLGRTVIVPEVPDTWRANSARQQAGMWRVVYAPETGFLRVAQGFDAGDDWATRTLGGLAATGAVTIDGIEWDEYAIASTRDDKVDYALATRAGRDMILIYGDTDPETAAVAARGVSAQILTLRDEETP